jgi:hypothetical protein
VQTCHVVGCHCFGAAAGVWGSIACCNQDCDCRLIPELVAASCSPCSPLSPPSCPATLTASAQIYLAVLTVRVLLSWFRNIDWFSEPWNTLRQVSEGCALGCGLMCTAGLHGAEDLCAPDCFFWLNESPCLHIHLPACLPVCLPASSHCPNINMCTPPRPNIKHTADRPLPGTVPWHHPAHWWH